MGKGGKGGGGGEGDTTALPLEDACRCYGSIHESSITYLWFEHINIYYFYLPFRWVWMCQCLLISLKQECSHSVTLLTEKCSQILKYVALWDQMFLHQSFLQDAKNKFSEGRTVVFKLH